ncbi:MAG: glycosyltransferase family 4 protein [Bacteroidetes bacterium]|nr:glycosyltransferase family 4 protein [Bacteroidota bacterium]
MSHSPENHQPKVLHISSWFPTDKKPFLGNFIELLIISISKFTKSYFYARTAQTYERIALNNICVISNEHETKKNVWQKLKSIYQFYRHVKNGPYDIIHFHVSQRLIPEIILTLLLTSKKTVLTEQGSYLARSQMAGKNWFFVFCIRWIHRNIDQLVVLSEYLQKEVTLKDVTPPAVIGNIVLENWFENAPQQHNTGSEYVFLHVSTVDANKNAEGILQACLQLKNEGIQNFKFKIISDEDYSHLLSYSQKNGLVDIVSFEGPIQHTELKKYFQQSDCFILNSNIETFSIVAAEALSQGLYLISTPVGLVVNLPDSVVSITLFNDPSSIATAMITAINQRLFNGISGQRAAQQFSESTISKAYSDIYNSLIS